MNNSASPLIENYTEMNSYKIYRILSVNVPSTASLSSLKSLVILWVFWKPLPGSSPLLPANFFFFRIFLQLRFGCCLYLIYTYFCAHCFTYPTHLVWTGREGQGLITTDTSLAWISDKEDPTDEMIAPQASVILHQFQ